MEKLILSEKFTVQTRDFINGLLLAVVSAILPIITQTLQEGSFLFDWQMIGTVASSTFIAYIAKKFLEPAKIVTTYNTNARAKKVAVDIERQNT